MTAADWIDRRARWRKNPGGKAFLLVCSWLFGAGAWLRRRLFEAGLFKSRKLRAKVICVGNLTTGGTGKTPAVVLAAQTLRQRSHKVAILSRGYGRAPKDGQVTTLLDDSVPSWAECGDEPWMMKASLAGLEVPILVCPDRVLAGTQAVSFYHAKVLILDDGFQHLALRRDLDVVMVSALDPFGGRALLPLGNLREPIGALAKAGMIVLTHVDLVPPETVEAIKAEVREHNRRAPILESVHQCDFLLDIRSQTRLPPGALKGKEIAVFSALADPEGFERQLEALGANIVQRWRFPDHHAYGLEDLRAIETVRSTASAPLVTTFKDMAKLPRGWEAVARGQLWAMAVKLEIVKGKNLWIDTLCKGL